jgi:uncharacterized membrane protein
MRILTGPSVSLKRCARRFALDRCGNVAVMSALLLTVIMGFGALGVDLGKVFTDRRKAQSAVDLAALSAVGDLNHAVQAARATVRSNDYPVDTPVDVVLGTYTPDPALAPAHRFKPSDAADANAARVILQTRSELFFGRVLTGLSDFTIRTSAVASQAAFAEIAIGSRLAALNGGLLNRVLGSLLGAGLSLSAMDYNALLDADIDLFDVLNAAATRAELRGPTYDSVLDAKVDIGTALAAMVDAGRSTYGNSPAVRALDDIAQSVQGSADMITLGTLFDAGPYRGLPLGEKPKIGVNASMLDLLTAAAQVANGQHQVAAALDAQVPGILGASLMLAIGERPVTSSWVAVGGPGTSVHTAQTRLLLIVQVGGSGSIASVTVPIYLEIAAATAKLASVQCGFPDVQTSTAVLDVQPGIIDAWIGDVSIAQFENFSVAPNPGSATLINTPLLKVTGRAHATITNMAPQPVTFSYDDIQQQTRKTVSTQDFTSSLTARLLGDLQLKANILGLGLGVPQVLTGQVAAILAGATAPIDRLLADILASLGVGLGQADVWVPGVRCDGAVLVN